MIHADDLREAGALRAGARARRADSGQVRPALAARPRPGHNGPMTRAAARRQPDLFGTPQSDLFADEAEQAPAPRSHAPSPDQVRLHLTHILTQARAAETLPWDARKTGFYKQVVPQMTLWLPEDEAAQWRLDFSREIARLEASA